MDAPWAESWKSRNIWDDKRPMSERSPIEYIPGVQIWDGRRKMQSISRLNTWKKALAPRKLLFYVLFHGTHVALFAVGW